MRVQLRTSEFGRRPGHHQQAVVVAVAAHLVEEHHLVGEDVGRVAVVVVEVTQLGVQETRRAGGRDHPGRPDLSDVLTGPVHLALTLLDAERLLGALRHVVDHRVPDGAGVLQHVHVDVTERVGQHVEIDRPRVVHVERRRDAVADHQPRIADRAVGGRAQRDDHDVQLALRAAEPVLHRVGGLEEPVKPQHLQRIFQVRHRIVRQQHDGVLVDVLGQQPGVEVVLVQVRDVQVVAVAQRVPVQAAVVRERKPRREVGRVDPRVAQNAAGRSIDPKAGVADACDLH